MANSEPFHATTKVLKNNAIDDSMSVPSVSNLNNVMGNVLGVFFNEYLSSEFEAAPDLIPQLQTRIELADSTLLSNQVTSGLFLDDLLQQICRSMCSGPYNRDEQLKDKNTTFAEVFLEPLFDEVENSKCHLVTQFIQNTILKCDKLLNEVSSDEEKSFLFVCKTRLNLFSILFLRGYTHSDIKHEEIVVFFIKEVLLKKFDVPSLVNTICTFTDKNICDPETLDDVFDPVFTKLRQCVQLAQQHHPLHPLIEQIFHVIKSMLTVQYNGRRPVCDVLCNRSDFIAETLALVGYEQMSFSYLGPFFSMSTVGTQDDKPFLRFVDKLFKDADQLWRDPSRTLQYFTHQTQMAVFRREMHDVIYPALANAPSRSRMLDFLSTMLETNRKRAQLQADRTALANNGTMINLFSVMLQLSEKIQIDKIQEYYICHPKVRIDVKEEPRISYAPDALEKFQAKVDVNFEPKFTTECFYLTMFALHVCMNPTIYYLNQLKQHIRDAHRAMNELQEMIRRKGKAYENHPMVKRRIEELNGIEYHCSINYMCHDCVLHDESLLIRTLKFVNVQLSLLLRPFSQFFLRKKVATESPTEFATQPEIFVESALDFLVYMLQDHPMMFLTNAGICADHLLTLSCNLKLFKNPYLASKVVNVVFLISPLVNPPAEAFFNQIVNNNYAGMYLFSSLSKFYADVESTGAHTEFYDKFNIRRSIQMIFKCMWRHPIHRNSMIETASKQAPEFIRFINMVINDTTFLLDESLSGLKKIRDIEALMENENEFNALSEEDRNQKVSALTEAKRSVRTWMILCNDTIELFILLTTDSPQIFYDALGERIAAMLNYNMLQLLGPRSAELKVKDAKQRFEWDPRQFLQQIVTVYINLSSEKFAESIAMDERSYTPEAFNNILSRMTNRRILDMSHTERFKNLIERAERFYDEKTQFETDFGDDIPDEFKDELIYTMMTDPVRLPSGQVLDKKNILRHLLSDKTNPFTRQPLSAEELVPDVELKERIENWVKEKKAVQKAASAQK